MLCADAGSGGVLFLRVVVCEHAACVSVQPLVLDAGVVHERRLCTCGVRKTALCLRAATACTNLHHDHSAWLSLQQGAEALHGAHLPARLPKSAA